MEYSEENSVHHHPPLYRRHQLTNTRSQYMRKSQIRPPSRIPSSPGKGLSEITESEGNMRSKPASKLPPPTSFKHKIGPCCMSRTDNYLEQRTDYVATDAEPDPKQRKTLAERAGEPRSIVAPTPSSRPAIKGTSLVAAGVSPHLLSHLTCYPTTNLHPLFYRPNPPYRTIGWHSQTRTSGVQNASFTTPRESVVG